jgi:hypothetical protein
MSKLADRLLNEKRPQGPGLPCGVSKIMESVSEDDRKALEFVFEAPSSAGGITNVQIHKILMEEGHVIAFASIRMHRAKRCRCYVGKKVAFDNKKADSNV